MKKALLVFLNILLAAALLSACTGGATNDSGAANPGAASTSGADSTSGANSTPESPAETGQANPAGQQNLTVFAAASLTDAFTELGRLFETNHPGVTVTFNFAGSQSLRAQLAQGAQADVFASANLKEMEALQAGGLLDSAGAQVFAGASLVLALPNGNPGGLTSLGDLSKPGIKLVIASAEVPLGSYTLQLLDNLEAAQGSGFKDKVLANVVSYENDARLVLTKVELGEADAGIVYAPDVRSAAGVQGIDVPVESRVSASYPIAALKAAPNAELAQAFIAYVLSSEGQNTLALWGFEAVQ